MIGSIITLFLIMQGNANIFLTLTRPKKGINFKIFNNPYEQHYTFLESAPDHKYVHENMGSCVAGWLTHFKLNNFGYFDMNELRNKNAEESIRVFALLCHSIYWRYPTRRYLIKS